MYAWVDLTCWLWSLFMIVYGIYLSTGEDDIFGYDEVAFWICAGVGFFLLYPIILEFILWFSSRFSTPHPPSLNFSNLVPIAYHPSYNITAGGIERMHPFDSRKYGKVFEVLKSKGIIKENYLVPIKCPRSILRAVHPFSYLLMLCYSLSITSKVEVPVCIIPAPILRFRVLNPMLYATYGSLLAGCAAIEKGYAINLSGGYHHCSSNSGGGFCIYADITILIYWMRYWYPDKVHRVMVVDLDAHQGNGHERDFIDDEETFIIDFFNPNIYPGDTHAKKAIRFAEHITESDRDESYCAKLENALNNCIENFKPSFIVYNAGTDCMEGDPLGRLEITPLGIVQRDEIVFKHALKNKIPVVMLLSGGYQQANAPVIADSISNLFNKFNL